MNYTDLCIVHLDTSYKPVILRYTVIESIDTCVSHNIFSTSFSNSIFLSDSMLHFILVALNVRNRMKVLLNRRKRFSTILILRNDYIINTTWITISIYRVSLPYLLNANTSSFETALALITGRVLRPLI